MGTTGENLIALKCRVARAQLATALDLFIRDKDPVAVQCLACGGSEVLDAVAAHIGETSFSTAMIENHPTALKRAEFIGLRNQYWNAFKHLTAKDGTTLRADDVELLNRFNDQQNDAVLFGGWHDYMMIRKRLPIEVQVFQVWWYAVYESKLRPRANLERSREIFPRIRDAEREEQKRLLRRAVEKYRKDKELLDDPRTEPGLHGGA